MRPLKVFSLFLLFCFLLTGCLHLHIPVVTDCHPAAPTGIVCSPLEELQSCALTEELALSIALWNNKRLAALYESLGIAQAGLWQARLLPNPIFSCIYRFATQPSATALIDLGLMHNFIETLLIPWKKRMASFELEMAEQMLAQAILEVSGQTKIAFYELQAKTLLFCLTQQLLEAAEASYDAACRLFKAGNLLEIELLEQEIRYQEVGIRLLAAEKKMLKARESLNVWMGLWGCQIQWNYNPSLPPIPYQTCCWEDLESQAIAASVELSLAKTRLMASASGLKIGVLRQVFPEADAGVAVERDEGVWYVGPAFAVAIPIFDFGQAKAAAAQAEICRQWDELTALAIEIRSFARKAGFQLGIAEETAFNYEMEIVPRAEELTTKTLHQNSAMQIGVIPLLHVKQEEIERKIESVKEQSRYWISRTVLDVLAHGHSMELLR